jgi:hypothetical protein
MTAAAPGQACVSQPGFMVRFTCGGCPRRHWWRVYAWTRAEAESRFAAAFPEARDVIWGGA